MRIVCSLVLACVLASVASAQIRYWPTQRSVGYQQYYQPRVYAAYDQVGDYRNYYQGYVDAAWYGGQRATVPGIPYYTSPGVLMNPYYHVR